MTISYFIIIILCVSAAILLSGWITKCIFKFILDIPNIGWRRKIKWLEKHEFERCVHDVSAITGYSYAWRNSTTKKYIEEYDILFLTYKELINKML